jgi:SAM-dependent methyltransferase
MRLPAVKYVHREKHYNLSDPDELVPIILQLFQPATVCDVGCGLGTFLYVFKQFGKKVMGFDGPWVDRKLLNKYLPDEEFREVDFEKAFPPVEKKFGMALCLEVAEHLPAKNADQLIQFLVRLSDTIIFSAAIPFQGGDNHYNEQWEEYWERKFNRLGYKKYDLLRHQIWHNKKIKWWYRQNMVVYSKNDLSEFPSVSYEGAITQECYEHKTAMLLNYSGMIVPNPWKALKMFIKTACRKLLGEKAFNRMRGKN